MRIFILALVALFITSPALADTTTWTECTSFVDLAATDDNQPLVIGPPNGAVVTRVACVGTADVATPAQLSFEDLAGNAIASSSVTCSENAADAVWVKLPDVVTDADVSLDWDLNTATSDGLVFDVDNAATTSDVVVCATLEVKQ